MNDKAVLLSIQPRWCGLIASGKKTIEVRKTRPKIETPFKCYIYQSKSKDQLMYVMKDGDENYGVIYHGKPVFIKTYSKYSNPYEQKVIGEFVCDEITRIVECCDVHNELPNRPCEYYLDYDGDDDDDIPAMACLSVEEIWHYIGKEGVGYAWHISNLKIYDTPKELNEFEKPCSHNCSKCKYYYPGGREEPPSCEWEDFEISKPPQSWCYVEVSENEM